MTHKLTRREAREVFTALRELGTRVLPSLASDLKVAALQRTRFRPIVLDMEEAQNKLVREIPLPEDIEAMKIPPSISEARANRFNVEVLETEVEIKDVPDKLKLTEADLPKTIKTGAAEENREGLANILAILPDWLYELPSEE